MLLNNKPEYLKSRVADRLYQDFEYKNKAKQKAIAKANSFVNLKKSPETNKNINVKSRYKEIKSPTKNINTNVHQERVNLDIIKQIIDHKSISPKTTFQNSPVGSPKGHNNDHKDKVINEINEIPNQKPEAEKKKKFNCYPVLKKKNIKITNSPDKTINSKQDSPQKNLDLRPNQSPNPNPTKKKKNVINNYLTFQKKFTANKNNTGTKNNTNNTTSTTNNKVELNIGQLLKKDDSLDLSHISHDSLEEVFDNSIIKTKNLNKAKILANTNNANSNINTIPRQSKHYKPLSSGNLYQVKQVEVMQNSMMEDKDKDNFDHVEKIYESRKKVSEFYRTKKNDSKSFSKDIEGQYDKSEKGISKFLIVVNSLSKFVNINKYKYIKYHYNINIINIIIKINIHYRHKLQLYF